MTTTAAETKPPNMKKKGKESKGTHPEDVDGEHEDPNLREKTTNGEGKIVSVELRKNDGAIRSNDSSSKKINTNNDDNINRQAQEKTDDKNHSPGDDHVHGAQNNESHVGDKKKKLKMNGEEEEEEFITFLSSNPRKIDLSSSSSSSSSPSSSSSSKRISSTNYQPGVCGLRNNGNTCYLNSGMQSLSHIVPLRKLFLNQDLIDKLTKRYHGKQVTKRTRLLLLYSSCMKHLWSGNYQAINIAEFVREFRNMHPRFGNFSQQDSCEFMRYLLDHMHEELKLETSYDHLFEISSSQYELNRLHYIKQIIEYNIHLEAQKETEKYLKKRGQTHRMYDDDDDDDDDDNSNEKDDGKTTEKKTSSSLPTLTKTQNNSNEFNNVDDLENDDNLKKDLSVNENAVPESSQFSKNNDMIFRYCHPQPSMDGKYTQSNSETKLDDSTSLGKLGNKNHASSNMISQNAIKNKQKSSNTKEKVYQHFLKKLKPKLFHSPIQDIFEGQLLSEVKCHKCRHVSLTVDSFFDLSVPIPDSEMRVKCKKLLQKRSNQKSKQTHVSSDEKTQLDDIAATSASKKNDKSIDLEENHKLLPDNSLQNKNQKTDQHGTEYQNNDIHHDGNDDDNDDDDDDDDDLVVDEYNDQQTPSISVTRMLMRSFRSMVGLVKSGICGCFESIFSLFEFDSLGSSASSIITFGEGVDLKDCLATFFMPEFLIGENKYRCEHCKSLQNATKRFHLMKLPPILCIHVKRFNYHTLWGSKVGEHVSFPLTDLTLEEFTIEAPPSIPPNSQTESHYDNTYLHPPRPPKLFAHQCSSSQNSENAEPLSSTLKAHQNRYELISVVNHHGSLFSGHYTAYVKNNGKWFDCNDSFVGEVSASEVSNSQAYILFYERKDD